MELKEVIGLMALEVIGLRPWKLKDDSPAAPKQGNKLMSMQLRCNNFQAVTDRDNFHAALLQ
jgi:hypothetical protein